MHNVVYLFITHIVAIVYIVCISERKKIHRGIPTYTTSHQRMARERMAMALARTS